MMRLLVKVILLNMFPGICTGEGGEIFILAKAVSPNNPGLPPSAIMGKW
jgi:hypothetical protein